MPRTTSSLLSIPPASPSEQFSNRGRRNRRNIACFPLGFPSRPQTKTFSRFIFTIVRPSRRRRRVFVIRLYNNSIVRCAVAVTRSSVRPTFVTEYSQTHNNKLSLLSLLIIAVATRPTYDVVSRCPLDEQRPIRIKYNIQYNICYYYIFV